MAFYEWCKEELKSELAAVIKDSTVPIQLGGDVDAEAVDPQERLDAKDGVIPSIVKDFCASLGPSIGSLVENFPCGT